MMIGKKVLFLHPGKTGGSSIEHMLIESYGIQKEAYAECHCETLHEGRWLQHNPMSEYQADQFDYRFATIRCPYTRFQSAWHYNRSGFKNLVSCIDELADHLPIIVRRFPNSHFLPQHHYTHQDGAQKVDYLVRLEHFASDARRVCSHV